MEHTPALTETALLSLKLENLERQNRLKLSVKKLLKKIDLKGTGLVKSKIFIDLLKLHGIVISESDINRITRHFENQNERIRYTEALKLLEIDQQGSSNQWRLRIRGLEKQVSIKSISTGDSESKVMLSKVSLGKFMAKSEVPNKQSTLSQQSLIALKQGSNSRQSLAFSNSKSFAHLNRTLSQLRAPEKTSWEPDSYQKRILDLNNGRRRYKEKTINYSSVDYDLIQKKNSNENPY
ncbi:hypothetical protein FGO68_gene8915 [Halteria grandinella]|uniref:EF-hand domain-containing protein n=1 Tax=Halteria grandinella TaxID=5974 RepID=A0A8J8NDD3_HALGN|nr:hypothetical protein FGO68_gene8915 [Halteria grandinella]